MATEHHGPFRAGDRVQLTGPKGKINTITLVQGAAFGTHRGDLKHDDIIGKPEGSVVQNQNGIEYLALRPLMTDFVLSMPRGAAIVYPKDAAQIVVEADIFPGARVIEAGVGSGALSMYLLRAIGERGTLDSFERREDFAEIAIANVSTEFGARPKNWRVHLGDLQDLLPKEIKSGSVDRVVLDMLAPWECIDVSAQALSSGGVILAYVATVTQLSRVVEEIRSSGHFTEPESWESSVRGWHVEGLAVRPEHRMIGHTGFLVKARRLAPGTRLPIFKSRPASKSEFTDEDMSVWNPEHLERRVSDKKVRRNLKQARLAAEGTSGASTEQG